MIQRAGFSRKAPSTVFALLLLAQTSHSLPDVVSQKNNLPHTLLRPRGGASDGFFSTLFSGETNRVDLPDGSSVGPRNGGLLGRTFEASAIPLGADVVPLGPGSGSRAEKRLLASWLPDALRFRFHFLWFMFGLGAGLTLALLPLAPLLPFALSPSAFALFLRDQSVLAARVRAQALKALGICLVGAWLLQYWTVCGRPRLVYRRTLANQRLLAHCPGLVNGFVPTPYLFNGCLQTLWMIFVYWPPTPLLRSELLPAPDGGVVTVEWCEVSQQPEKKGWWPKSSGEGSKHGQKKHGEDWKAPGGGFQAGKKAGHASTGKGETFGGGRETKEGGADLEPLVIVVPGVAGSGSKSACRGLMAECLERRWSSVCVGWRGYCGTPLRFPFASHLGYVDDLHLVVEEAKRRWPKRRLFGVGLSMGGHALMRYCGGRGEACALEGGVALSAGFSIVDGFRQLYSQPLADFALNFRFKDLLRSHPSLFHAASAFDPRKVWGATRTAELDREFTCKVAGWASPEQYQEEQAASRVLAGVRRPLLAVNALDDVIVDLASLSHGVWAGRHSDHFCLALTPTGGHAGFFEGLRGRCWMNRSRAHSARAAKSNAQDQSSRTLCTAREVF